MGKKGDPGSWTRAANFLLKPVALTNLVETYSKRYAERPGGYTRVLKLGNRKGDNAPAAVLELVDNPEDLRWEMTARAVGFEILQDKMLKEQSLQKVVGEGAKEAREVLTAESKIEFGEKGGLLRPKTRWNVQKLIRYRGEEALDILSTKAAEHAVRSPTRLPKCPTIDASWTSGQAARYACCHENFLRKETGKGPPQLPSTTNCRLQACRRDAVCVGHLEGSPRAPEESTLSHPYDAESLQPQGEGSLTAVHLRTFLTLDSTQYLMDSYALFTQEPKHQTAGDG